VKDLIKLISDNAPGAIIKIDFESLFNRKIVFDAPVSIYQFLVAVQVVEKSTGTSSTLTDKYGNTTSHINGLFYRTIKMMSNGIIPIFVFDGEAPEMKSEELKRRSERREEALEEIEKAKESGDVERINILNKRTVKVTKEIIDDCKKLLRLMGIPVVEAKSEAEAQCAEFVKAGIAWATGSEDSDTLVCGSPILLKHLSFSDQKKKPVLQINLDKVLEGLELTYDQFVDVSILLGCDFCPRIKGIGPKRALDFIKKYKTIENVLKNLDKEKYSIPVPYHFEEARRLFKQPDVFPPSSFQTDVVDVNEEGLIQFMVEEKGFNLDRIKNNIEKLKKCKTTTIQTRITDFFKITPSPKKETKKKVKLTPKKKKSILTPKKENVQKTSTKKKKKSRR